MKLNLALFRGDVFPPSQDVTHRRPQGDSEVEACWNYFHGKRLFDVKRSSLLATYHHRFDMSAIPTLLSDEAFVFFLPALMQIALDGQDDRETQIPDLGNVLGRHLLEMAQDGRSSARLNELLRHYSPAQLGEVAAFLLAMRDHEKEQWAEASEWTVATDALRLFWGQFLIDRQEQLR